MSNKVIEVLRDLVENAARENINYRGHVYRFSDPGLPVKAGVALVRARLKPLEDEPEAEEPSAD